QPHYSYTPRPPPTSTLFPYTTLFRSLNLAAWLTARSVYDKPKAARKGVWIDEAFFLSEVPTGRVLMNRFARDSRKWNVRVLLSRSEEHTSELQSRENLVCRLLLEKKN